MALTYSAPINTPDKSDFQYNIFHDFVTGKIKHQYEERKDDVIKSYYYWNEDIGTKRTAHHSFDSLNGFIPFMPANVVTEQHDKRNGDTVERYYNWNEDGRSKINFHFTADLSKWFNIYKSSQISDRKFNSSNGEIIKGDYFWHENGGDDFKNSVKPVHIGDIENDFKIPAIPTYRGDVKNEYEILDSGIKDKNFIRNDGIKHVIHYTVDSRNGFNTSLKSARSPLSIYFFPMPIVCTLLALFTQTFIYGI